MSNSPLRIREIATYGQVALPLGDEELLAQMLDEEPFPMQDVAHRVIGSIGMGGLARELVNGPLQLTRFGLSVRQICRLKHAYEFISRCMIAEYVATTQVEGTHDAIALFQIQMQHLDHEELHVVVLDTRLQVIEYSRLYKGTANSGTTRVAEVLRPALMHNCPNLLIAHNHPSASSDPSPEDIAFTEQMIAAAHLLGIELVDHLIIGNPYTVSLRQHLRW